MKNPETSLAILADKVAAIRETGAEYCVSADASCLMHIGGALARAPTAPRTIHLAEVLARTAERRP